MYPDSEFARPVSSFRKPAPIVSVDPDNSPDVTVCFRHEWIPYIIGSLRQLLLQSTWDTTDRAVLNLMQARAQLLIAMFIEGCPPDDLPAPFIVDEMEYQMAICEQLRWENGVLQGLCCGEWVNIGGTGGAGGSGAGAIPGAVTQPPPTTMPPTNECREFYVTLNARDKWLLPFPVSAGATIQILDALGGWNDGTPTWACPTGAVYGLGICGAPLALTAGDPIPTLPHMQIVAQYGTSGGWFDPMALPFVIPVGVSNAQVTFQANDSVLTDNQGSVTFKVRVCNQAVETWCYEWDLADQSGPLTPFFSLGVTYGTWVPGLGWVNAVTGGGAGQVTLAINFDCTYATHVEFDLIESGAIATLNHGDIGTDINVTPNHQQALVAGSQLVAYSAAGMSNGTFVSAYNDTGAVHGLIITRLKVSGIGTPPSGPSHC